MVNMLEDIKRKRQKESFRTGSQAYRELSAKQRVKPLQNAGVLPQRGQNIVPKKKTYQTGIGVVNYLKSQKIKTDKSGKTYSPTGKKYGDYLFQDYAKKKNYQIYKSDSDYYYEDPSTKDFVKIAGPTPQLAEKISEKKLKQQYKTAIKQGYKPWDTKGDTLDLTDRLDLDTTQFFSESEREKYANMLAKNTRVERVQADLAAEYDDAKVRKTNDAANFLNYIDKALNKKAYEVVSGAYLAPEAFEYGKVTQGSAQSWYNKLYNKVDNKSLKISDDTLDKYSRFNPAISSGDNLLAESVKQFGQQWESNKTAAAATTLSAAITALLVTAKSGDLQTGLRAGKRVGEIAYVASQTKGAKELEGGLAYRELTQLGIPDSIAREEAKNIGTINSLIETGESLIDILTLGGSSAVETFLAGKLSKKYGEKLVNSWLTNYGVNTLSEGLQEGLQEGVSVWREKEAYKKAGTERPEQDDLNRILEAGWQGAKVAATTGILTSGIKAGVKVGADYIIEHGNVDINGIKMTAQQVKDKIQTILNNIKNVEDPNVIERTSEALDILNAAKENFEAVEQEKNAKKRSSSKQIEQENTIQNNLSMRQNEQEKIDLTNKKEEKTSSIKNDTETYNTVKNKKQLVHLTNNLRDILTANKMTGDNFSIQVQNKNQKYVGYGQQAIKFKPEILDQIDQNKMFEGDGMTNRAPGKESTNKFGSLREMIQDNPTYYNEVLANSNIPIIDYIEEVTIPKNTSKELIDLLNEKGIKINYYNPAESYNQTRDLTKTTSNQTAINEIDKKISKQRIVVEELTNKVNKNIKTFGATDIDTMKLSKSLNIAKNRLKVLEEQRKTLLNEQSTQKVENIKTTKEKKISKEEKKISKEEKKKEFIKNTKQSKFVNSVTESDFEGVDVYREIADNFEGTYETTTNKADMDYADRKFNERGLENSFEEARQLIESERRLKSKDLAFLIKVLIESGKNKDIQKAIYMLARMTEISSEYAQVHQAMRILKKASPEAKAKLLLRQVEKMKKENPKKFGKLTVTDEMLDKVLTSYDTSEIDARIEDIQSRITVLQEDGKFEEANILTEELNTLEDEKATEAQINTDENIDEIKDLLAAQVELNLWDYVKSFRHLSMLGTLKGHLRNILGNTVMKGLSGVRNKISGRLQDLFIKDKTKTRTFKKASKEVIQYINKHFDGKNLSVNNKYSDKSEIVARAKTFGNAKYAQWLNKAYDLLVGSLETEDMLFKSSAYKSAVANYLAANDITTVEQIKGNSKIINAAHQFGVEQALYQTFQAENDLSKIISNAKKAKIGKVPVGQALEIVVPYSKVSGNIMSLGAEYSPLGLTKTLTKNIYDLKHGKITSAKFIDNLSSGLTGTALFALGIYLKQLGIIKTTADDKDKKEQLEKVTGKQDYSIQIGDVNFKIDWLTPTTTPIFMGAEIANAIDYSSPETYLNSFLQPIIDTSFVANFGNYEGTLDITNTSTYKTTLEKLLQDYLVQLVPGAIGQIAKTIDPVTRSTAADKNKSSFEQFIETTVNKLKNKIPGLTKTLEPQTSIWGDEAKKNTVLNAFNQLLSPGKISLKETDSVINELTDVYDVTKDAAVLPDLPGTYYYSTSKKVKSYQDEEKLMRPDEYTQFKKTYGTTSEKLLRELFNTFTYEHASYEEKANLIKNVYKQADNEAKKEMMENRGLKYYNGADKNGKYYKNNKIIDVINQDIMWNKVKSNQIKKER